MLLRKSPIFYVSSLYRVFFLMKNIIKYMQIKFLNALSYFIIALGKLRNYKVIQIEVIGTFLYINSTAFQF